MPRIDPLEALKNRGASLNDSKQENPAQNDDTEQERVKITVKLPIKTSNELKKLAIDHRIGRDHLLYLLVRQLLTDPELLKKILRLAQRLD